jgi:tRNA dimethylallyltransferase
MTETGNKHHKNTLLVIAGPTAIGKTKTAIILARHFETEIISADSRQFYKALKIGAAAPSDEELASVKHHFVGHLSVNDYYNVSRFEEEVLATLDQLFKTRPLAIMTGGSGLYIDAVCRGIDDLPLIEDALREKVKNWHQEHGIGFLQEKLQILDPEYFRIVDQANPKRLMRAIEVCLATGQTFTSLRKNETKNRDFDIIKIGLNRPRAELFENISLRTEKMIADGLVEEVKNLEQFRDFNALNTVGYKEIFDYLDSKVTLAEAIENIKTNTRRYAKRQLTWFKRDSEMRWFMPEDAEGLISFIEDQILKVGI